MICGSGVPAGTRDENPVNLVKALFREKLNLEVAGNEIVNASRIGAKPQSQRPDNRYIQVTVSEKAVKMNILESCKRVKPTFYVNEFLTPRRSTIMYALRTIKRKHPEILKGFCSRDGNVYAYTARPGSSSSGPPGRDLRSLLNTHGSLVRFCNDIVGSPLETFLQVWPH